MNEQINSSRRKFIKTTGLLGAGLILEIHLPASAKAATALSDDESAFKPNAWMAIQPDNTVIFTLAESEMGQGVMTALPMLLAEELEIEWSQLRVRQAPYNPVYGSQTTGGSTSVSGAWETLRKAGATARTMLVAAAAKEWKVDVGSCVAERGKVIHRATARSLTYGELSEKAAKLPVPEAINLKSPNEYRIIGKSIPRIDTPSKVTGEAQFGIDIKVPGMLIATIKHCPAFGGSIEKLDDSAARAVEGVKEVVKFADSVAVVAANYWSAKNGLDALKISWNIPGHANFSTNSLLQEYKSDLAKSGAIAKNEGDALAILGKNKTIEADYFLPFQAHATMEPMNCTAHVHDGEVDVWAPTQTTSKSYSVAFQNGLSGFWRNYEKLKSKITGKPSDAVRVYTTLLGGGFGRRLETDYVKETVLLSKAVGAPVKLIWSREEDMQHDYYRPLSLSRLMAVLDAQGYPKAWLHRIVSPSILNSREPGSVTDIDPIAVEGAQNLPYAIPNLRVEYIMKATPVPLGFWRSVGSSINAYVTECFIDELAHAARKDPLEYRLHLLKDAPQHQAVLKLAAQKANWRGKLPAGHAQGIAVHYSFGSYVAEVAEVSLTKDNRIKVHKVTCAVDCGTVVNPDSAIAQIESAIAYGLTATLKSAVTIENGAVMQGNFHDFPLLDIGEMPEVEVYFIQSTDAPRGLGEPAVPPIPAAVMNASYMLTRKRIRQIPPAA